MARVTRSKAKELYYRVREVSTGTIYGSNSSSFYSKKGVCIKEVDKLNSFILPEDRVKGIWFELVEYEMVEVNRKTKISKILADTDTPS
jgi:hypothetical protein